MKDTMLTTNYFYLPLIAFFLTAPLYAMNQKSISDAERIFLFEEELHFNFHDFEQALNTTTLPTIFPEIKFVDLPPEVTTLEQAEEAQTNFGKFVRDVNKTKEEKERANNYFNILNKKYNAYFIVKDKKDPKHEKTIRDAKNNFISTASELVEEWRNLK